MIQIWRYKNNIPLWKMPSRLFFIWSSNQELPLEHMVQNDGGLKSKPNSTKKISCEIQMGMGCHQQIPKNICSYFGLLFHLVVITLKRKKIY